ncbi:hypothetical protein EJ02DRAFT_437966 [Clathrospora elynae]|uniref:Uncharacterized protein n=1 Tax=Clathrospora elynae TaxID=706981 RepID=A0A6A5SIX3_9PLEO|nr:hypothetical protein EJ02DRAFT_437966 [Clathrospora elynae]
MAKFIKALAKREGASTKARPKSVALCVDSEAILFYLWCCDEYTFTHPRIMVQLTFFLQILTFWGLRPGEVVESSVHRGSNKGIKYGDVTLSLVRCKEGLLYQLSIRLRNRKFKRGVESETQDIVLKEETEPRKRFMCPVTFFLAMALADGVFVDQKIPADFVHRPIKKTANSREIHIRDDKKDLPVLRKLQGNSISLDQIMSAHSMLDYLKSLCSRCGYKGTVTCYSFRRGFANAIDGKVSQGRMKQVLGHKSDQIFQSYITSVIGIDTQNVVRQKPEDSTHVDFSRSIALTRDVAAPRPQGSLLDKRHLDPPDELIDAIAARYPNRPHKEVRRLARKQPDFSMNKLNKPTAPAWLDGFF